MIGCIGDGINDALSLRSANVGTSVVNVVDVAKEAADLVLLKQDPDILGEWIIEDHNTFANTLKYIFMVTSAIFATCSVWLGPP